MSVFLQKTPENIVFMHQSQSQVLQSTSSQCKAEYRMIWILKLYCIISIPGNQNCLLLCLMKGGKTFDLEFQANLAIFVFWPHSLWPAFHFTLMPKDFLMRPQPGARHPVWFGPDLWKPYLQPETSSATTKETWATDGSLLYLHKGPRGAKPTSTPNLCQMAQECHGFLHLRGGFLPTHLQLEGAPSCHPWPQSLQPCLGNTHQSPKRVPSPSYSQLQRLSPSPARYYVNFW